MKTMMMMMTTNRQRTRKSSAENTAVAERERKIYKPTASKKKGLRKARKIQSGIRTN
jgi:hypothetical protein